MKNIIRFIIAFFVLAGLFYLFQVGTEEESFRATKREEPTVQRIEATDAPPKDSSSEPSTSKQEKRIEQLEKQNDRLRSQVKKLEEEVEFLSTPGALPPGTVHLKAGEEWIVDGQWKLKVTSATALKERNRYVSEKPAEVVRILYTYENLGYRNGKIDLYFYPTLSSTAPAKSVTLMASVPSDIRTKRRSVRSARTSPQHGDCPPPAIRYRFLCRL